MEDEEKRAEEDIARCQHDDDDVCRTGCTRWVGVYVDDFRIRFGKNVVVKEKSFQGKRNQLPE